MTRSIPPFEFHDSVWRFTAEHMCAARTRSFQQYAETSIAYDLCILKILTSFTLSLARSFTHPTPIHTHRSFSLAINTCLHHINVVFVVFQCKSYRMQMCAFFIASKCHFITVLFRLSLMFVCLNSQSNKYYYGVKWIFSWICYFS